MPQSIYKFNLKQLQTDTDSKFLGLAKQGYMKDRFLLGCGNDSDEFLYTFMIHEKLCNQSCTINDYVEDKLLGKPESCSPYRIPVCYKKEDAEHCHKKCDAGCEIKLEW